MDKKKKEGRYQRVYAQVQELCNKPGSPLSRMATIAAVLHHKFEYFFWTGFYLHFDGRLVVGPYQGPVACQELEADKGVCWAAAKQKKPIIVPDVEEFAGHIACDARSKSEITLPVKNQDGNIIAVMDVDSAELDQFDEIDEKYLSKILRLI